jgi:predicted O-methyltransferase YrrM
MNTWPPRSVADLCPNPEVLGLKKDLQGWHSNHSIFASLINEKRSVDLLEVGSWKGASALRMAELARAASPGEIINLCCVDTWLGSTEHLEGDDKESVMPQFFGYPQLYHQFLYNVALSEYADIIYPVPQTSLNAARLFKRAGWTFGLIYLDGSHEYEDTYSDLEHYFPLLKQGGTIFGDDYRSFPGVFAAVTRFAYERKMAIREHQPFWVLEDTPATRR